METVQVEQALMNLGRIFKKRLYKKMLSAIDLVKLGILDRLVERYRPKYGDETADSLAAAVVNELFSHKPSKRFAQEFSQVNRQVVEREIAKLKQDEEICHLLTQAARVEALVSSGRDGNLPDSLRTTLENLESRGILVPGAETPTPESFLQMANEFYQGRK